MPTSTETSPPAPSPTIAAPEGSTLLIVRHGDGRGPLIRLRRLRPNYYQPMFDDIATRWPALYRRMRFWETGSPQPDVCDCSAVVFLLQDPLRESYPECFREATELARRAKAVGAKIANPPECLSNTIKTKQSRLWTEAGLPTPPCLPFHSREELLDLATEMAGPMVLKADHEHAQLQTILIDNVDELRSVADDRLPIPGSLSPVIDTRSGYRQIDPKSPYATHYHKKRVMVFGNHVRNNHVFFSEQPIVGCVSSTFGHFRSLNPIRRIVGNRRCRSHIESDLQFHYAKSDDADLMRKAASAIGIDYCAIDYARHADGRIVLWEANPHFSLHRWPIAVLARQRKLKARTPNLHESAAHFFSDLLGMDP